MMARVYLCQGDGVEKNLDAFFTKTFIEMCEAGIPIVGFTYNPQEGCFIIGDKECLKMVFKENIKIEDFDYEQYILTITDKDKFWTTELDPLNPMKSKLLKWVK